MTARLETREREIMAARLETRERENESQRGL
jgi:hypothetical protein